MPFYQFAFRYDPSNAAVERACGTDSSAASGMVARAEAEEKLRQEFYRSTGVKREPNSWASIELNANNDELIRTLHHRAQGAMHTQAGRIASAVVYDKLTTSEQAQAEWFLVLPKQLPFYNAATDDFSSQHEDGYPTCHAFQVPPGIHILERHHVSEKFRDVVTDNGLAGWDFLWARDKGKYRPRLQWYCAVATKPLGHGLRSGNDRRIGQCGLNRDHDRSRDGRGRPAVGERRGLSRLGDQRSGPIAEKAGNVDPSLPCI